MNKKKIIYIYNPHTSTNTHIIRTQLTSQIPDCTFELRDKLSRSNGSEAAEFEAGEAKAGARTECIEVC